MRLPKVECVNLGGGRGGSSSSIRRPTSNPACNLACVHGFHLLRIPRSAIEALATNVRHFVPLVPSLQVQDDRSDDPGSDRSLDPTRIPSGLRSGSNPRPSGERFGFEMAGTPRDPSAFPRVVGGSCRCEPTRVTSFEMQKLFEGRVGSCTR